MLAVKYCVPETPSLDRTFSNKVEPNENNTAAKNSQRDK